MTAPILRLYADVWTFITNYYLDLRSITTLILIGSPQLSFMLRQTVHSTCQLVRGPVLDVEALLRSCSYFTSLKELSIGEDSLLVVKKPLQPLIFGAHLTSLSLSIPEAFTLIVPLKLSAMMPVLLNLSVKAKSNNFSFCFKDLDLPGGLTELVLCPQGNVVPSISYAYFGDLPRSITSLFLTVREVQAPSANTPSSEEPGEKSASKAVAWPPYLSNLQLAIPSKSLILDTLPRDLTRLDISSVSGCITAFPPTEKGFVFPWRRFFPRLISLELPFMSNTKFDNSLLLCSIFDRSALDANQVKTFIDLVSAEYQQTSPIQLDEPLHEYPSFKNIALPMLPWGTQWDNLADEMARLKPFLERTIFRRFHGSWAVAKYFKATPSLILSDIVEIDEKVHPSVVTISTTTPLSPSVLSLGLRSLSCTCLRGSGDLGSWDPAVDFLPARLAHLDLRSALPGLDFLKCLPPTITNLSIPLHSPSQWNLIAERLVNLKSLTIRVELQWTCNEPLTAIKSLSFKSMYFGFAYGFNISQGKPKFGEFFRLPSLFPASTRTLSLRDGPWHASLLPILPRGLDSVDIDAFSWHEEVAKFQPYPEAEGMSHADLIKSLPPSLSTIRLTSFMGENSMVKPSIALVEYLPRSLVYIIAKDAFQRDTVDLMPLMPPYLIVCNLGPGVLSNRPPGYIN